MIRNEREYRITTAQARKFRAAIATSEKAPPATNVHPRLQRASIDAMRAQLEDLERDLEGFGKMKRISLTAYDAEHVYEWLRVYWRGHKQRFGRCYECERIGRRLERLIGQAAVRRTSALVNKLEKGVEDLPAAQSSGQRPTRGTSTGRRRRSRRSRRRRSR